VFGVVGVKCVYFVYQEATGRAKILYPANVENSQVLKLNQGPVISHEISTPYPGSEMVWQDRQYCNKEDNQANRSTFPHRRSMSLTFWSHLPIIQGYAHQLHEHCIYPLMPSPAYLCKILYHSLTYF